MQLPQEEHRLAASTARGAPPRSVHRERSTASRRPDDAEQCHQWHSVSGSPGAWWDDSWGFWLQFWMPSLPWLLTAVQAWLARVHRYFCTLQNAFSKPLPASIQQNQSLLLAIKSPIADFVQK